MYIYIHTYISAGPPCGATRLRSIWVLSFGYCQLAVCFVPPLLVPPWAPKASRLPPLPRVFKFCLNLQRGSMHARMHFGAF